MVLMELERIWKKRSFIFVVLLILVLQLYLLWYTTIHNSENIPLSGYKKINETLQGMTYEEKEKFFEDELRLMEAMFFEEKSIMYLSFDNELTERYQEKVLDDRMDYFNENYDMYMSGDYLRFTDNLEHEDKLIQKAYEEYKQVSGYDSYIDEVVNGKDKLNQISIFAEKENTTKDTFSQKNIDKSAADHESLLGHSVDYFFSDGVVQIFKLSPADALLMLLAMYFGMQLVWDEKETGLFMVTRATKGGRSKSIVNKVFALMIHAAVSVTVIYGIRFVWFGAQAGFFDATGSIQSVAEYVESALRLNLGEFSIAVILTKIVAVFLIGIFMMCLSLLSSQVWMPWLCGGAFLLGGYGVYRFIDMHSSLAIIKYISYMALLEADRLFGGYFNINLLGNPVSRMAVAFAGNLIFVAGLLTTIIIYYVKFYQGNVQKLKGINLFKKARFDGLFWHESYKVMIINRAILVLLIFFAVMGSYQFKIHYSLSDAEEYYQGMMLELEGPLDEKKEKVLQDEQARFDAIFAEIDHINGLEASGELSELVAESMRSRCEIKTALYPVFEVVMEHYERALSDGTPFLYDTGYRELFWKNKGIKVLLKEMFIVAIFIILAFGSALSMENEKQAWMLIGTTTVGTKKIRKNKWLICMAGAAVMTIFTWVFRFVMISLKYPMRAPFYSTNCLLGFDGAGMSIIVAIVLHIGVQLIIYGAITAFVLFLSGRRQKTVEVYIIGCLVCVLPIGIALVTFWG